MQPNSKPDTIVLIHGFWVTPRSWEKWITRFESRGYRVIAPAYPGFEVEVEALNQDPTPIEKVTVTQIIDHLVNVVKGLDKPPILMGHSAGGVFVQVLLDRGYGASGVVFNSAPTEGVLVAPLSQLKATFPVLRTLERSRWASRTPNGTTRSRTRSPMTSLSGCTSDTTFPRRARSSGAVSSPT